MEINFPQTKYNKTLRFVGKVGTEIVLNKNKAVQAKNIKNEILRMGPVYIKVGQLMSTRTDVFPEYLVNELKDLQSNVEPMPFDQVNRMFQKEFDGKRIDDLFCEFSEAPIAAASIGQVHTGILRTNPEHKLAIKICRENIDVEFRRELQNIIELLEFMVAIVGGQKHLVDTLSMLREQYTSIDMETDMIQELENMIVYRKLIEDNKNIIVPRVYSPLSTKNILMMEYVPSVKITDLEKHDNNVGLATELIKSFVSTTLNHGYIHCDPHPGNIGINEDGMIVLYDFGLVRHFDIDLKDNFRQIFFALMNRSTSEIINYLLKSNVIIAIESGATSIDMLTSNEIIVLEHMIQHVYRYMNDLDVNVFVNALNSDQYIDVQNIPFDIDVQLMYIFKSFGTLEGVCKQINSNFNYVEIISEFGLDFFNLDMLIDKANYDIRNNLSMTPVPKSKDSRYTKRSIEMMNKKMESNNKYIMVSLLLSLIMDMVIHVQMNLL